MHRSALAAAALLALLFAAAAPASAQFCLFWLNQPDPGDWGDAPEGNDAYPWAGVIGSFPTCFAGVGPNYYVFHGASAMFFGPSVDFEMDGNGGICTPPPYENDEFQHPVDGDAGLTVPTPYTIIAGQPVTFFGNPGQPLGPPCGTAQWGRDIDIEVHNTSGVDGFVNVLVDWNMDGTWDGQDSYCGPQPIPEKVVTDLPVLDGTVGLLSSLLPAAASFTIGPDSGYVWVRFTIANCPLGPFWYGAGAFDMGETEDYLLRIGGGAAAEYGDAPDGVLAYPDGTVGDFPTCTQTPNGFVRHANPGSLFLGPGADLEGNGNAGHCFTDPYDQDECGENDGDAGLRIASAYTIDVNGGFVACPTAAGIDLGVACGILQWGVDVDLDVTNFSGADAYFNALFDWDGDGRWGGAAALCGGVPEHAVVDLIVPDGHSGSVGAPTVIAAAAKGWTWARFTLSDTPVGANWDGSGQFLLGETEDYLFRTHGVVGVDDSPGSTRSSWGTLKGKFLPDR